MASAIWKAFDLVGGGELRQILGNASVPDDTIQALVDIVSREEYRLTRLLNSKRRK